MLHLIGSALKENGVSNSFIQGNVHRRNAAINKFKMDNDEDNVIMLSLEKSASGTNLTEATHIMFVEPIDSSIEQVKAIESQAIARACRLGQDHKVKLIRILTKDTIEEEIYNNINKDKVKVDNSTNKVKADNFKVNNLIDELEYLDDLEDSDVLYDSEYSDDSDDLEIDV